MDNFWEEIAKITTPTIDDAWRELEDLGFPIHVVGEEIQLDIYTYRLKWFVGLWFKWVLKVGNETDDEMNNKGKLLVGRCIVADLRQAMGVGIGGVAEEIIRPIHSPPSLEERSLMANYG